MARWWARSALVLVAALIPAGVAGTVGAGCGSTKVVGGDAGADGDADAEQKPTVTVLHPEADPLPGQSECTVTITTGIPLKQAVHIAVCSDMDYPTNPPSGGDHWPVWAAYTTYEVPVRREMYVHNMEHGAVVLLHHCQDECPEVLAALADARDAVSGDALCLQTVGPTERVVTTPDPLLDVPLAAAAWGATYTATCVDEKSLIDFVKARYGHGTESTCAQGKLVGAEDGGAPVCGDGGLDDGGSGGADGGVGGSGGSGGGTGAGGAGGGDAG
jgi:uncharacterized membrane protein YgcG